MRDCPAASSAFCCALCSLLFRIGIRIAGGATGSSFFSGIIYISLVTGTGLGMCNESLFYSSTVPEGSKSESPNSAYDS